MQRQSDLVEDLPPTLPRRRQRYEQRGGQQGILSARRRTTTTRDTRNRTPRHVQHRTTHAGGQRRRASNTSTARGTQQRRRNTPKTPPTRTRRGATTPRPLDPRQAGDARHLRGPTRQPKRHTPDTAARVSHTQQRGTDATANTTYGLDVARQDPGTGTCTHIGLHRGRQAELRTPTCLPHRRIAKPQKRPQARGPDTRAHDHLERTRTTDTRTTNTAPVGTAGKTPTCSHTSSAKPWTTGRHSTH